MNMLIRRHRTLAFAHRVGCARVIRARLEMSSSLRRPWCALGVAGLITLGFPAVSRSEDIPEAVDSSLFGEGMLTESLGSGLEPIGDDAAGYSGTAAEELTEASQKELKKKFIPEALLLKVALGGIYDDNLFLEETDKAEDLVLQARLGLAYRQLESGNSSFSFSYEAVGFMYQEYDEFNDINHEFGVTGSLTLPKTQLGFSANYQRVSAGEQSGLRRLSANPTSLDTNSLVTDTAGAANQQSQNADRESGSFSVRDVIAASLSASRPLASKTNFTAALGYSGTIYQDDTFQDSQDYNARLGLNYEFSGKTTLGLAGTYGKLDNGLNSTQTYQNILVTASYNASGKLAFRGEAGLEFRQFGSREPIEVQTVSVPAPAPVVVPVVEPAKVAPPADPVPPPAVVVQPSMTSAAADLPPGPADPPVTPPVTPATVTPAPAAEAIPVETVVAAPVTDPAPVIDYTTTELPEEEDSTRFVFNLQAVYQIRVRTALRMSASKGTGGAATLGSSSVQRTTVSLGLDQGIGRRFALGVEGGYQLEDYGSSTIVPASPTTKDSTVDLNQAYLFGRATLNYMPRPNTSIGIFYEFRRNDGGATGQTYEANRIGVQAAISF